ncbi:MAG: DUF134 domain-containing protein [Promethearchaeota archaeon]
MGRRTRMRFVKRTPDNLYFTEVGESTSSTEQFVILTIAEFEAMRLKHYVNLNQKEAADKMGVSQPTFSRILENAHQKTTQALMEGKEIRVYGGNINIKQGFIGYGCLNCNEEWEDENASKDKKVNCPKCESEKVYYLVREPL